MIMYVNVNSLVLWIIQFSPVARTRHQYSTSLPGFSETPSILTKLFGMFAFVGKMWSKVRRDGSVVAWGDPVRGGDVTPVLFKLKQGPGSLGGLQVSCSCHGIVSMVIFYLHFLCNFGARNLSGSMFAPTQMQFTSPRPDAVAWQASKCQNLSFSGTELQRWESFCCVDHSNLTMCLQCFEQLLSTKGTGLPSMALPVNMFHVLCTSQMSIVVINHFLASLPATWLVAKVCKSLLLKDLSQHCRLCCAAGRQLRAFA